MPYSKLVMTDDYDWLSCARAVGVSLSLRCGADMLKCTFSKDDKFSPNTSEIIADRVFRDRAIGNYRGTFSSRSPFVRDFINPISSIFQV